MKRKLVAILLTALLILQIPIFVSCDTDPSATDISKIIAESVVNDEIVVRGVVYLTTTDGFYIADESQNGRIFVSLSEHGASVGDELIVQGKYQVQSNRPMVVEATLINKGSNKDLKNAAVSKTIAQIRALSGETKDNYSEFVTVKGFVIKDSSSRLVLRDYENLDQTLLIFNPNSNSPLLDCETMLVSVNVALRTWTLTSSWTVDFGGTADDITIHSVAASDVTTQLTAYINAKLPEKVYGAKVELPDTFPMVPGMTLTWTVPTNNTVAINAETGAVTITAPTAEASVEFTATAKIGTSTTTVKRTSKIQPITLTSIGDTLELLEDGAYPISNALVSVKGRVVGKSRNQSGTSSKEPEASLRAIILWDSETNDNLVVEFGSGDQAPYDFAFIKTVNVGDDIEVKGELRTSNASRLAIVKPTAWETKATNQEVDYSTMGATELLTVADYTNVRADEYGNGGKLFKLVNPYLTYSDGKTMEEAVNSNAWIPFGPAGDSISIPGSKQIAFLITAARENIGNDFWHSSLNMAASTPKQINATIYTYIINFTSTSYLPFVIPSIGAIQHTSAADQIRYELGSTMPTEVFSDTGLKAGDDTSTTLPLPQTNAAVDGNKLTWASNKANIIDPATGVVKAPAEDTVVKLTLTFAISGVASSLEFNVSVFAPPVPLTVSEALAMPYESKLSVKAIIVAFGNPSAGSSFNLTGIVVSDGINVLFVKDIPAAQTTAGSSPNFTQYFVTEAGDTKYNLKVGDEVIIYNGTFDGPEIKTKVSDDEEGTYYDNEALTLSANSSIELVTKNKGITWGDVTVDATITNEEEANAYFAQKRKVGAIVKFTANTTTPFYATFTSSTYAQAHLRLHYNSTSETSSNNLLYGGTTKKGIVFRVSISELSLGLTAGTFVNNFLDTGLENSTAKTVGSGSSNVTSIAYGHTGTMYAVYVGEGNTLFQMVLINVTGTAVTKLA